MYTTGRQETYMGNRATLEDIGHGRKITTAAIGKERVDSSFMIKPVKTSAHVNNLSEVKLPKGSVAVGYVDLGARVTVEEPNENVTYVTKEIPVEETVYQPRVTRQYVEKEVPVYYDEHVYEDVEVDEIVYEDHIIEQYVDKIVEIPRPVAKTVERKIPVTLTVPKIIPREVEKLVEVPSGEVIQKEVKVVKEKVNHKRRFLEKPVPIVVEHNVNPIVSHDPNIIREVEVVDHYPVITPVDVHIAKPVNVNVRPAGAGDVNHRVVTVPAAHYNTLLKKLNPNLHEDLPLFMEDGVIPMLNQELSYLYPPADAEIEGFNAFEAAFSGIKEKDFITDSSSTSSRSGLDSNMVRGTAPRDYSEDYASYTYTSTPPHGNQYEGTTGHSGVVIKPKKKCIVC